MKLALILSAAVLVAAVSANATILAEETFTHPDGNLVGQTPEVGGMWAAHSGAGAKPIQVTSGAAHLQQTALSGEDVNTALTATMAAGDKFYAGFDLINTGGNADVYFAHFMKNASTFSTRIYLTSNGLGDYTLGIGDTTIVVKWASGLATGTKYRVVSSYDFDSKVGELWINPVDESSTKITYTSTYASNAIVAYGFRQASPAADSFQTIDNLVVASTFAEAAVPEPATMALLGLGGLAMLRRRK